MNSTIIIEYLEFGKRVRQLNVAKEEYFEIKKKIEPLVEKVEKLDAVLDKLDDKNDIVSAIRWCFKYRKLQKIRKTMDALSPAFVAAFQKWEEALKVL